MCDGIPTLFITSIGIFWGGKIIHFVMDILNGDVASIYQTLIALSHKVKCNWCMLAHSHLWACVMSFWNWSITKTIANRLECIFSSVVLRAFIFDCLITNNTLSIFTIWRSRFLDGSVWWLLNLICQMLVIGRSRSFSSSFSWR